MHVGRIAKPLLQAGAEITVDFQQVQFSPGRRQRRRQCSLAGPDFYNELARTGRNHVHDPLNDLLIGQEILAETLAWPVRHDRARNQLRVAGRRAAIDWAASAAASRLPASARPLPARSSAVP